MRHLSFSIVALLFGVPLGVDAQQAAPDYLPAIRSPADFELLSVPSELQGEVERTGKLLLPVRDDPSLLGPVFQNTARYPLHFEFMKAVFPDRFPDFKEEEYRALVEQRATRKYFAGSISRLKTVQGVLYGFTVFTAISDAELLTQEEVKSIYDALGKVFDLQPLYYAPDELQARLKARGWQAPGFPIYLGDSTERKYQAYTRAIGYGRVRLLTLAAFNDLDQSGRISSQDILVLEQSPRDIEGVVAGVITGQPQGELSHIAIRTARRGTPNAYLASATDLFGALEGKLIRLEVAASEYTAVESTPAEAERWWAEHRPRLSETPTIDADYSQIDALEEMDLSGLPLPPESRYGGKATNFARLQRILSAPFERYQGLGFAVPMRYYLEFLRSNHMESAVVPGRRVTYEQYLAEVLGSPEIQSDSARRFAVLEHFRQTAEDDGAVDPNLVTRLEARIEEVFGSFEEPVRFRSSSNVEDALEFNGAGLYESTAACAADDLDGDGEGPSICDPSQDKERKLARALKKVWASLWTFRAYEERAFYQIPQERVAMGVLVSSAFLDEKANGVAFTGNPSNAKDRRYVVTAQVGEESVVSPEPGKTAEKDFLEITNGQVTRIERAQRSTLAAPGEFVLSDGTLREIGALLGHIERNLPVDLAGHRREVVLFDSEFKIGPDGALAIKQVRPFLVADSGLGGPTFELVVPPDSVVCGVFVDGRPPQGELEAKSQVRFAAGRHALPTDAPVFEGHLFDEVLFGPDRVRASSVAPGRFRVDALADGTGNATYSFGYEEVFSLPDGTELVLEIDFLEFTVRRGEAPVLTRALDDDFITNRLAMRAVVSVGRSSFVRYASCGYETLPLWQGEVEIEGGDSVRIEERYRVPPAGGSGPANIMAAELLLGGTRIEVRDYWRLVYAAQHHNVRVRYWIVLDPPVNVPDVGRVHVVELNEPSRTENLPAKAAYLDAAFVPLSRPQVLCYQKALAGQLGSCDFRRGDASASGAVNLTDAIFTLHHSFAGGAEPACADAADFDDNGVVELGDVVLVLAFLFRGVDLSAPPGPYACGPDPTPDPLPPCTDSTCQKN